MYQQKLPAAPASGPGWRLLLAALGLGVVWLLQGCGGGGGSADVGADPGSGEVLVTLTDAEGDFLSYTVDIESIRLEHANGTLVETLPQTTRLDFAQYVDMSELLTAAQVPNGRYVGGSITLDYSNADVQVEVGGVAVPATVVDQAGQPLTRYTLELRLDDARPLVVAPGLPALLNIDFDLAASHEVDTTTAVPTATASPFLLADIEPVDEKELRARGPLREVDIDGMYYAIRLRPWHRRLGDYGHAKIHVRDDTEFEVNGESWLGADGLRALEAAGVGTPTVALGVLDVSERRFTASRVLAGDSVPGERFDAVFGNVTARTGNVLTVRGATVVPRAGSVIFNDDVAITISDDTVVRKPGEPGVDQGIGAVSVGQRVTVFGEVTSDPTLPGLTMDASQGRIRLRYTRLFGLANSVVPGQINVDLRSIDRRRIALFDFSGTGITPDVDADPSDYEVATTTLDTAFVVPQTSVQIAGFVRPFGEAPPDFESRTVVDVAVARALLGVGWGAQGTTAPFLRIDPAGLVIDLMNPQLGERHHIRIGEQRLDLLSLPASPLIVGIAQGPRRFAILQGHRVQVFRDFARFSETLGRLLDGATRMHALYARGAYAAASNTLQARVIAVHLSPPAP